MPEHSEPLVVIGASARWFAASARRAGWAPYVADLFDDVDLRTAAAATCCVRECAEGYPHGLVSACRGFPAAPFCYVGAVENHPEIIRAVAADRPLFGSPPGAVAAVRDPWALRRLADAAGFAAPDCRPDPLGLPLDGTYLRKPLAGAGGRGIVPWDAAPPATSVASFWQQRIAGDSWSAAYVISADGGRLLGASRQLTGEPWCHARPFAYCGSVHVPLDRVPPPLARRLAAVAPLLAAAGLRGAVGIDLVVDPEGVAWMIEVNPRPTASMELIELATGESLAAAHVAACGGPAAASPPRPPTTLRARWAKAVLFAPCDLELDAAWPTRLAAVQAAWNDRSGLAGIADVPRAGGRIPAGGPVCTLLAAAPTAAAALALLRKRAAGVLGSFSPPGVAARC